MNKHKRLLCCSMGNIKPGTTKTPVSLERQGLLRLLPEADEISCTQSLAPSFNCRFSVAAVDSPASESRSPRNWLEEIVRNALTVQIKQAEHILEILHERERKALICFSALERQEEKAECRKDRDCKTTLLHCMSSMPTEI